MGCVSKCPKRPYHRVAERPEKRKKKKENHPKKLISKPPMKN
jgi:hypothetical protein